MRIAIFLLLSFNVLYSQGFSDSILADYNKYCKKFKKLDLTELDREVGDSKIVFISPFKIYDKSSCLWMIYLAQHLTEKNNQYFFIFRSDSFLNKIKKEMDLSYIGNFDVYDTKNYYQNYLPYLLSGLLNKNMISYQRDSNASIQYTPVSDISHKEQQNKMTAASYKKKTTFEDEAFYEANKEILSKILLNNKIIIFDDFESSNKFYNNDIQVKNLYYYIKNNLGEQAVTSITIGSDTLQNAHKNCEVKNNWEVLTIFHYNQVFFTSRPVHYMFSKNGIGYLLDSEGYYIEIDNLILNSRSESWCPR